MNNLNPDLADFVPTVLCLCRGDPQQIKELMEMALAAAAVTPATRDLEFPYSQAEAARIVCAAIGRRPNTFLKNSPWLLLERRGLGEGIGISKPRPTRNGRETRDYSQAAVDFLSKKENWGQTRRHQAPQRR